MRIEIPKQVEWILEQLRSRGYEAFAVGGCVRDTLLHRVPGDWDITTSAKPEEVKQVFGKTIDTGLKHGTVTVMLERVGYEITTYRIDGEYEDGRHPREVSFTSELREDLRRRDFTINAMAYSHETGIVDVFGGMKDLECGVIRCVGDAMERFTEDALRILRAIRFSAQLGFSIEEKTYRALSDIAPNLANVSKERIQVELTKTLLSAHPNYLFTVDETGMSPYISKTFPVVFSDAAEGKERLKKAAALPPDKAQRWAAFLAPAGEPGAAKILRELKMDNDTINKTGLYVQCLPNPLPEKKPLLRQIMSRMDDQLFDGLLELKETLFPEDREQIEKIREITGSIRAEGDCIRLKDMAVTGKDLISAGIHPGPRLGKILNILFEAVLAEPECNKKEYLLKMAEEYEREKVNE